MPDVPASGVRVDHTNRMSTPHPCEARESCGVDLESEVARLRAENEALKGARAGASGCAARLGRAAARARLRAGGAVGAGDLAAGDAARHRPLRGDGRADRRPAGRAGRGRGQARERDLLADRLRLAGARGAARARRRDGARDPDRRAVVHQRADHGVHALAALPGRSGSRPTGARTRGSSGCSRAGARGGSCSTTTRSTWTSRRRSTASRPALQERGLTRIAAAIPPSVDGEIKLVQSEGLVSAQRGVRLLKAVAIVLPLLVAAVPGGRGVPLAPAPARAAARRDRRRAGDAAAGGGARRRPLRLPRRARLGRAPARRGRRASSTRSSCSCATGCGSC